ncbi:MAG: PH domain-containing protein [Rubripirellula sp.]|nr:PH domain-containing protein [Rubripirellula sp.]
MPNTDNQALDGGASFRAEDLTRPARTLLLYYLLCSLLSGPFFPIAFVPLFCKYATLRYRFDDSGIAMQWGVLFRREIYLTYRRIQDIHLTRNIIQRWMGLATLAVQTASGSATPEMSIEGILQAKDLRDHLYGKMRGSLGHSQPEPDNTSNDDLALELLTDIRDNLHQLVQAGGRHEQ